MKKVMIFAYVAIAWVFVDTVVAALNNPLTLVPIGGTALFGAFIYGTYEFVKFMRNE